jgi:hypothetical protein
MLAVVGFPHGSPAVQVERGYVVPRASHLAVTSDARLGRVLAAERQVMYPYKRP